MTDSFEQLSDKELELGYWWTIHRIKIKAIFLIVIILGIFAIYLNAGWRFYVYLQGTAAHEQMLQELTSHSINYEQVKIVTGPNNLRINNAIIMPAGSSNNYDIVAEVENVNQRWWLRQINYQFEIAGKLTDEQSSFILPGETKYLYYFNYQTNSPPNSYRLVVKREIWQRVKNQDMFDSQGGWRPAEITVSNIKYNPVLFNSAQGLVTFDISNNSSFNFWEVNLQVLLWQGQQLVDFNTVTIADLVVGEKRAMEVLMSKNLPSGLRAEIDVSADSLAEENLKAYNADLPGFIR